MDEKDTNIIGYCEECGNAITTDDNECYVDEEGHYFCSVECVFEYYQITKVEM